MRCFWNMTRISELIPVQNSFSHTSTLATMAPQETPFQIAIPAEQIALLRKKLELTVLPDELEDAGREYGASLSDIRRLVTRWKDGYDWRKHEAQLNTELPQFTTDIEIDGFGTLNVHYVHKRSDVVDAIPLLFVHGWPGSFLEVRHILPLLTESSPKHPSFHVVAFSLPGYGFSEAPKKKGFELTQYAELGNKLMTALGYNEYVTQDGCWGHLVSEYYHPNNRCKLRGEHSNAWHTNAPMAPPPHPISRPLLFLNHLIFGYTPKEKAGFERSLWFRNKGNGYYHEQSTQPQTLGYGLTDSPVGLLAWIYEKLVNWTDDYPWDDDEVLTWISIYWFSRAGPAASVRIYFEVNKAYPNLLEGATSKTTIPMGYSYFPKEIVKLPKRWLRAPNLVFESDHTSGGHFAAHEKPKELVDDLRKMFGKGGPAFGVVHGRSGYDPQSRL
ncbi:Alpha/Beta hydrolase protein [Crucibulum laeve]|uniref:Alpha/Beta hydrolase protein n=1 Tax=Crucibulum laeve TaxID=68775 RepID=A0A5C3M9D9_9AGAR|nr:Alpha/Beta hydrolase protein [Crucibulum laeve]